MKRSFFPLRTGLASLALMLAGGCATPLPDRVAALDSASRGLPDSSALAAYNLDLSRLCAELDGTNLKSAGERLRELGVRMDLPPINLPLRGIRLVKAKPEETHVGVPVVLEYDTIHAPLHPPEGLFVNATAVFRNVSGTRTLAFETEGTDVELAGKRFPAAVAPGAAGDRLRDEARHLAGSGFMSMLRPVSMEREPQVYLLDPYDPARIPLLMVHGLQSTPVAFAKLVNALRAEPEIRRRYQIWQFYYASGTPVLANALALRESLASTLKTLDPDGGDFATNHIVVVGHSMGGVISHTLVSTSGERVWGSVFRVPADKLRGNPQSIAVLDRILHFRRDPRVRRVVFMAAPHRGSPMADSFIGILGNGLARLNPLEESGFTELARENPEALLPGAAEFYHAGRFSAVRTLSQKSTALIAVAGLPVEVPFHNIIGQQAPGPIERGSDGVVPYWSSHLDGTKSEKIVRSGHGVIGNGVAIAEVIRILHENLEN